MQFPGGLAQLLGGIAPCKARNHSVIVRTVEIIHHIINHLVDDMDCAAVDINEDVHIVLLELMRSDVHSFSFVNTLGNAVVRLNNP